MFSNEMLGNITYINQHTELNSSESVQPSHYPHHKTITDSPFLMNKSQDKFVYPSNGLHHASTTTSTNNNNRSPQNSPASPSQRARSQDIFTFNLASSPFQNKFRKHANETGCSYEANANSIQLSPSLLSPGFSKKPSPSSYECDDETSQGMASYNYYSNIMTNLNTCNKTSRWLNFCIII